MSSGTSPQGTVLLPEAARDGVVAPPPAPPSSSEVAPPPSGRGSGATVMLDRPEDEGVRARSVAETIERPAARAGSVPDAAPSGPVSGPTSGDLLAGKYRLVKLLGQGGMGAVYEARHVEIGRRMAVKLVNTTDVGSKQQETIDRFRREARATGAIDSDHIVQVYDAGYDPGHGFYMAMELLRGCDLATALGRVGRLDVDAACALSMQIAFGLQAAHETGVVHRDLKPANIFLVPQGDGSLLVKLVDFGIAKVLDDTQSPPVARSLDETPPHQTAFAPNLTRHGSVVGTPQYMSPEQAQGLPVDARTDLYSLGAVLYEALTGTSMVPLLDTYEQTVVHLMTHPVPPPLRERCPAAPAALDRLFSAMVAHDPSARPADMTQVVTALVTLRPATMPLRIEGLELETASRPGRKFSHPSLAGLTDRPPASAPTSAPADDAPLQVPMKPSSRLGLGALLVALVAVGSLGVWVNRTEPTSPTPVAPATAASVEPLATASARLPVVAVVASSPPAAPSASAPRPTALVPPGRGTAPATAVRAPAEPPATGNGERKIGGAGLAEKF